MEVDVSGITKKITLKDGMSLSIPQGTNHTIINNSKMPLKLYTIYNPPVHDPNDHDIRQPVNDFIILLYGTANVR